MDCRPDNLDERFTALEPVQIAAKVRLDSAQQIRAPRTADGTQTTGGQLSSSLRTTKSLILR